MFEIKNKKKISHEDVDKFHSDIMNLKMEFKKDVVGIFISIVSDDIMGINQLSFNTDEIYIPKSVLSKETLIVCLKSLEIIKNSTVKDYDEIVKNIKNEIVNYEHEITICCKHIEYAKTLFDDMTLLKNSLETKAKNLKLIIEGVDPSKDRIESLKFQIRNYINGNRHWKLNDIRQYLQTYEPSVLKHAQSKVSMLMWVNSKN